MYRQMLTRVGSLRHLLSREVVEPAQVLGRGLHMRRCEVQDRCQPAYKQPRPGCCHASSNSGASQIATMGQMRPGNLTHLSGWAARSSNTGCARILLRVCNEWQSTIRKSSSRSLSQTACPQNFGSVRWTPATTSTALDPSFPP